ncbi:ribonuclease Z [Fictibacillus aquaticus]|uniref:Ribonuclease Z n=1 Tax=Fictibacillus aquaticus TaxID=2021314 RepID=A0A235FAL3_9BACL|nr:ribonuclease Z [Fictibacillus aquaticus]OYD58358.1 ribonuclease Z [Fictibacillus aquaticus]
MELYFLGTGAGMPFKERNTSAVALRMEKSGGIWLFDCGEATQHQFLHSSLKLGKIKKIWVTHLHGDHIFGLPGLLGSRSFMQSEDDLTLYGPDGLDRFVSASLETSGTFLSYPLHIETIEDGCWYEFEHSRVLVKKLNHTVPSYGFRIEEKSRPPRLKADLLKKKGVLPGPLYNELKNGRDVTLESGEVLKSAHYLHKPEKGKTAAILGDTSPCEAAVELAKDADVLVHESTFSSQLKDHAEKFGHSTAMHAAHTARDANAKMLILTHISARYHKEESQILLDEAQPIFRNTYIANDFSSFKI